MRRLLVTILVLSLAFILGACGEAGTLSKNARPTATPTATATPKAEDTDGDGIPDSLDGDPYDANNTGDQTSTDETTSEVSDANVFIKQKGFDQVEDDVYMGAVLKNNGTAGASDVEITFNALDRSGDVVATETADVSVIPAGETFNVGVDTYAEGEKVHSIEVYTDVSDSVGSEYGVPSVSRARVSHEAYGYGIGGGNTTITAQVRNNMDQTLSSLADVFVVMFNSNGKVIGGSQTFPEDDIRTGRRASVDFPITDFLPNVARVAVSVDNEVTD